MKPFRHTNLKTCRINASQISLRGKIPIIAGGTGLYIQSLIYNYPFEKEEITAEKKREVAKK